MWLQRAFEAARSESSVATAATDGVAAPAAAEAVPSEPPSVDALEQPWRHGCRHSHREQRREAAGTPCSKLGSYSGGADRLAKCARPCLAALAARAHTTHWKQRSGKRARTPLRSWPLLRKPLAGQCCRRPLGTLSRQHAAHWLGQPSPQVSLFRLSAQGLDNAFRVVSKKGPRRDRRDR